MGSWHFQFINVNISECLHSAENVSASKGLKKARTSKALLSKGTDWYCSAPSCCSTGTNCVVGIWFLQQSCLSNWSCFIFKSYFKWWLSVFAKVTMNLEHVKEHAWLIAEWRDLYRDLILYWCFTYIHNSFLVCSLYRANIPVCIFPLNWLLLCFTGRCPAGAFPPLFCSKGCSDVL